MRNAKAAAHCLTAFKGASPTSTYGGLNSQGNFLGRAIADDQKSESLNFRAAGEPNVTIV
jgi:hypothetical protein